MSAPLRLSFDVACPVEHAFAIWTADISSWWPADHTVTGEEDLEVVLQPHIGGRIYERTRDGVEHDWGQVTGWDPPTRLRYLWHLRQDRADATEVEIRFITRGADATTIEIEHRGWETLGAEADQLLDRNRAGWSALLPHYLAALTGGAALTEGEDIA